ncbi:MAG: ATP-binding protein [Rhodoferax sp.]
MAGPDLLAGAEAGAFSAMANLIHNAVRYTPGGGRVEIAWRHLPDGQGEFKVSDSGLGIAPEHLPRITERFYRVDRSRAWKPAGLASAWRSSSTWRSVMAHSC